MPCTAIPMTNSPILSPKTHSPFFCKPSSLQSPVINLSSFYTSSSSLSPEASSTSSSSRPVRIAIPMLSFGLENVDDTPREESRVDQRGKKRGDIEDRYSALVTHHANNTSKQVFFGVLDGHGGEKVAEFAAKNLGSNIINEVASRSEEGLEVAIREGYRTTDREFLKLNANGGSCCVTALVQNGELIVSNAGDCRAVMSRGGVAGALTVDHRPSRQDEMERIQRLGGYVDSFRGVWRIQGSLAVSRGIGDSRLKRWVIAEPETKILTIQPECEFLILASDGLWEKVSNQEAVELLRPFCLGVDNQQPLSACKKLVDLAVARGSCDDITAMVIQLDQFVQ
ncbi:unnamed protein product [Withania somnifera]